MPQPKAGSALHTENTCVTITQYYATRSARCIISSNDIKHFLAGVWSKTGEKVSALDYMLKAGDPKVVGTFDVEKCGALSRTVEPKRQLKAGKS